MYNQVYNIVLFSLLSFLVNNCNWGERNGSVNYKLYTLHRLMESKFHDGDCGPCTLCTRRSGKYKHFGAMDSELQGFINTMCGLTLEAQQCICYACAKQLARNQNNPLFKPRWLPKETSKKCNVSLCKNQWRSNTTVDCLEEILDHSNVC